jgi:hypothetical protein
MRDLTDPRWIQLKGLLFLVLGLLSAACLLLEHPTLREGFLLGLCVWAFCRAYYFAFYVIEHYVDPGFRFSGIGSALKHLMRSGGRGHPPG